MKIMQSDARHLTSMHAGGMIAHLIEAETTTELATLAAGLEDFLILGHGTNTLFPDTTTNTPVIKLGKAFEGLRREGDLILAGAAAKLSNLVKLSREEGLSGIEFLAGIPGTVGGAVWMNAGTAGLGIMDRVAEIELVDASGPLTYPREEIGYTYRRTQIPDRTFVTGITVALEPDSPAAVAERIEACLVKRRNQPHGASSGCIFKNPPGAAAGALIDQAGLKGTRIGGAAISEVHANFIINDGHATTTDILTLIELARVAVKSKFGIILEEEVRLIA